MAMATIGVLVIFFVVFDYWDDVTRGSTGVFGDPAADHPALGRRAVASSRLRDRPAVPRVQHGPQAAREPRGPARGRGARRDVVRLRYIAWVLSGALMGMGGAIWAQYNLAFDPKQFFFTQTFNMLAMIVVGGLASRSPAR